MRQLLRLLAYSQPLVTVFQLTQCTHTWVRCTQPWALNSLSSSAVRKALSKLSLTSLLLTTPLWLNKQNTLLRL